MAITLTLGSNTLTELTIYRLKEKTWKSQRANVQFSPSMHQFQADGNFSETNTECVQLNVSVSEMERMQRGKGRWWKVGGGQPLMLLTFVFLLGHTFKHYASNTEVSLLIFSISISREKHMSHAIITFNHADLLNSCVRHELCLMLRILNNIFPPIIYIIGNLISLFTHLLDP